MKKMLALVLALIMLFGISSMSLAEAPKGSGNTKTYRILSGFAENEANMKNLLWVIDKYQKEVDPDFKYELEIITSTNDLWEKVRLYLNGDTLPDIFSFYNGPLAEEMISRGLLVNMGELLKEVGLYDITNKALIDFFTSADGNMYMIPSSRTGEFFIYRKDVFDKYGLTAPTTWEEFINVCEVLKSNGEVAYNMRGADSVQYLRFLAFPGWTTTGGEFITTRLAGESFADSDLGMYCANLLYKLGTSGYFVPGYESLKMGDALDVFYGGTGAIAYTNTNNISEKLQEMYDAGQAGFFGIPVMEGVEGTGTNWLQHGGKSWAVNAEVYNDDPVLADFVKFWLKNANEAAYANGALSWFDTEVPEGVFSNITAAVAVELQKATVGWVSWDDKMTAATLTEVGDAAEKLAHGVISPEEFAKIFDQTVEDNGG